MGHRALLVLRTAHSLRGLLYPVSISYSEQDSIVDTELMTAEQVVKVSRDLCSEGLVPLLVVHPYDHVINSVIICRVESNGS